MAQASGSQKFIYNVRTLLYEFCDSRTSSHFLFPSLIYIQCQQAYLGSVLLLLLVSFAGMQLADASVFFRLDQSCTPNQGSSVQQPHSEMM